MEIEEYTDYELMEELSKRGIKHRIKINSVEISLFIGDREYEITAA